MCIAFYSLRKSLVCVIVYLFCVLADANGRPPKIVDTALEKEQPKEIIESAIEYRKPKEILESVFDDERPKEILESAFDGGKPKDILESAFDNERPKKIFESSYDDRSPKEILESAFDEERPKEIPERAFDDWRPKEILESAFDNRKPREILEYPNKPTLMVILLVRNKAHALPYFLGLFENLNYPKNRMSLWIKSDHNIDNSSAILQEWVDAVKKLYHHTELLVDDDQRRYSGEKGPLDWTRERYDYVMTLRQQGLEAARNASSDLALFIDADVLLENRDTLKLLIEQNKTIVGPLLTTTTDMAYSNFWGAADENGYYKRSEDYLAIVNRRKLGCFQVHLIHSVFLVDLRHADSHTIYFYPAGDKYAGPNDDFIVFQFITNKLGIQMHVLNIEFFGHLTEPIDPDDSLELEIEHFRHTRLQILADFRYLEVSRYVSVPEVPKDLLGFDQIYVINLERRPERRKRMVTTLNELGVDFKMINAVDGRKLNNTFLQENGIKMLPVFRDPNRPNHGVLTWGQVGCFLSHYSVWKDALNNNYSRVAIFEDDARFEILFRKKLDKFLRDVDSAIPNWDLLYLRRGINLPENEKLVESGNRNLVWPSYSYRNIAYALTRTGLQKYVDGNPLGKMVPCDAYVNILFNQYPRKDWMSYFPKRDLVAVSVNPLIVFPTHYRQGEANFTSDTNAHGSEDVAMFKRRIDEL